MTARDVTITRRVATIAGLLGFLLAVLTPLLPVVQTTATLNWPDGQSQNGRLGNVTAPLITLTPVSMTATIPCDVVAAMPEQGGMVLGLILDPQQISAAIAELEKASPGTLSGAILRQVQQTAEQRPSNLSLGFFVSLLVVLWSTSTGYYNFARGTLLAYGMPPQPYLRARARAFVGAIIGMLLTAVLIVLTAATLAYAGAQTGLWGLFLVIVNTLIGLAIMTLVLAGLFRFAVGQHHPRPLYLPGAALGAISTIAVFVGFGIYVNYATSYEAVYGALAGAIIFMLCVYFSAYAVLIGAALNADLSARRG